VRRLFELAGQVEQVDEGDRGEADRGGAGDAAAGRRLRAGGRAEAVGTSRAPFVRHVDPSSVEEANVDRLATA
jgi:hypothetical protein